MLKKWPRTLANLYSNLSAKSREKKASTLQLCQLAISCLHFVRSKTATWFLLPNAKSTPPNLAVIIFCLPLVSSAPNTNTACIFQFHLCINYFHDRLITLCQLFCKCFWFTRRTRERERYFIQWPYCFCVLKETVYISKLVYKNEWRKKSGENTNRAAREYINLFSLLFCLFDFEPDSHLTRSHRQPKLTNLTMWRPMKYVMFYACLVH